MKKIVISLSVIVMVFALHGFCFASNVIIAGGYDRLFTESPMGTELIVAGDSYAQNFYEDENGKDMQLIPYFQEGFTIEENQKKLQDAFYSIHKYILFSISVNDHRKNTHPNYFEDEFRDMVDLATKTSKTVFVHSYMIYNQNFTNGLQFSSYDYDNMVRKIANDYPNIYYIDMMDCAGLEYIEADGVHYNKLFNDILYDRIKAKIEELKLIDEYMKAQEAAKTTGGFAGN
ncbi:MAG: SGNH/GDSL hydrolase family protein [Lachnospiraceae bacterium]|nr:SGNH/GDSL hydrolase family protein [Lachnospiraceae bacterium]